MSKSDVEKYLQLAIAEGYICENLVHSALN